MSLSLGEHGRVPIGSGCMSIRAPDVIKSISALLSLVVSLPPQILLFSMLLAVETDFDLDLDSEFFVLWWVC